MHPTYFLSQRRYLLGAMAAGLVMAGTSPAARAGWWSEGWGGNRVVGSGNVTSETRPVGSFQAIHLKGAMKVVLRQTGKEAVEVRADDNLIGLVETTVVSRGGVPTLEIGVKKGASYSTRTRMIVTVDVAELRALEISGSGDVVADGLKTNEFRLGISGAGDVQLRQLAASSFSVNVSGSGDVSATGRTGKLSVSIAGSGDVSTQGLEADDVSVSIGGSGDARVNAKKTLRVSIAGSGDVDYTGDPAVTTSIAGNGTIKKR
jgi:hypothetical protein